MRAPTRKRARGRAAAWMVLAAAMLLPTACNRTIEEEDPPELVEHRIEPCRQWCAPMLSPDCGRTADSRPFPTVDDCVEDCAADEPGGWEWALLEDGTDACAEEWFAAADCMNALTCEEQRSFFRRTTGAYPPGFVCTEILDERRRCFNSTRSLDNPDGGR